MKKFTFKSLLAMIGLLVSFSVNAIGWPSNFEGVMLQGFYWDSYSDSRWTTLTNNADEYSQYFKLIWVPNSAKAGDGNQMGYMPQYWFTNHNSSFGTEEQLRTMIHTYKAKGVGIIEDVVINHRNGVTGWCDFPTEEWNGQTWHIGLDGICRNDNLAGSGHGTPTGNYDTGEQFDGCRDLDHTNANVQNNCKNYCKFLLEDLGYAGFRLDMAKGYSGQYTKMYNQYTNVTYSVGEYFDGSYDAVANWIESTGKTSAAFDFPLKFALNDAFNSNDMTKLVWLAGYTTPQPAGMIHYGYPQYAVTFVDNHDTYKDHNKFNGPVVAANAFILCSPGTPCVLLAHYKQYKQEIQRLINIRNSVGLHNQSAVNVLKYDNSCYMAEVTGSKGKLVVKIGSAMVSPDGYSNSDIVASGDQYCVWTKVAINGGTNGGGNSVSMPDKLYLMGHLEEGAWKTNVGISMTKQGNTFVADNVNIVDAGEGKNLGFFSFVTSLGTTGNSSEWDGVINSTDRYGATSKDEVITVGGSASMKAFYAGVDASSANSWAIAPGSYKIVADYASMTITVTEAGSKDPNPTPEPTPGDYPDLYVVGYAYGMTAPNDNLMEVDENGIYTITMPELSNGFAISGEGYSPFYSSTISDMALNTEYACEDGVMTLMCLATGGDYTDVTIKFDYNTKKVILTKDSGVENIAAENVEPVYYNLQGVRVENPENGIFIEVRGTTVTKVIK